MNARSYSKISRATLKRLGAIAAQDRQELFRRKPETGRLHSKRLFAVALCQGGARHYLDGNTGIKDVDVWSFYRDNPRRPFPYRRRGIADFGNPKFGQSKDLLHFIGRRVDLIGRSIRSRTFSNPVEVLRGYLRDGSTQSTKLFSQKAVILIEPAHLLGTVVWPE